MFLHINPRTYTIYSSTIFDALARKPSLAALKQMATESSQMKLLSQTIYIYIYMYTYPFPCTCISRGIFKDGFFKDGSPSLPCSGDIRAAPDLARGTPRVCRGSTLPLSSKAGGTLPLPEAPLEFPGEAPFPCIKGRSTLLVTLGGYTQPTGADPIHACGVSTMHVS